MRRTPDAIAATIAATIAAVALVGVLEAGSWIGRPFAGFLILDNGVVASAALVHWPATRQGDLYQRRVLAVDGAPARGAARIHARVGSVPVGSEVRYRFSHGDGSFERRVATRTFTASDFGWLFGVYLLNGVALGVAAVLVRLRGRGREGAGAALPFLTLAALWGLSAMDLYGPYRLFRLHALCESLLWAGALHMAVGFPRPLEPERARRAVVATAWLLAGALAIAYQQLLYEPAAYTRLHLLATTLGGASLLVLLVSQLGRWLRSATPEARRRVSALALGAALALLLPVVLTIAETWSGGRAPQNATGFTVFVFPVAIGYAVVRRRALDASP